MPEFPRATLLVDGEGSVRMAARETADLLGRDPVGEPLADLIVSPGREVIETFLRWFSGRDGARPQEPVRLAVTIRISGGGDTSADLHLSPVGQDTSQSPAGALVGIEPLPRGEAGTAAGCDAEEAAVGAALICRAGRILEAGEEMSALVGLPERSLAGWRLETLVFSDDLLPVVEILKGLESGTERRAAFGFRLARQGDQEPIEVAARARRVQHHGRPAVLVGVREVGGALRAARGAVERLTQLDGALAAAGDAVLLVGRADEGLPILIVGRRLHRLFGVNPERWVGRPFEGLWDTLAPAHAFPREQKAILDQLFEDPEAERLDLVELAGPGGTILERYAAPTRTRDGRQTGRLFVFRDVTARERTEARRARDAADAERARRELETLHEDLRLANEGLERRMSDLQRLNRDLKVLDGMKSNLLANVSHELQTPLVSIKGFTEMILKGRLGGLTAEQEKGLGLALRNVDRLIGMIDDLMVFAREPGPDRPPRLEVFDLAGLLDEAIDLMKARARDRGIRIESTVRGGEFAVRAERDAILQVALNILTNAVKYNRDGGSVGLRARRTRGGVCVEVSDTGIGIPRADLDRIFDRFYRAGNADGSSEGSGIGLAIARDILRRHGCTIRAQSEEGKGSTISFSLPPAPGGASEAEAPFPPRTESPRRRRRR